MLAADRLGVAGYVLERTDGLKTIRSRLGCGARLMGAAEMAWDAFECEGYKAFGRRARVELRAITVFFGKNGSGKTTLARLPIFLAASLSSSDLFALKVGKVNFGESFVDLAGPNQAHPRVSYQMQWGGKNRLGVTLQHLASGDGNEAVEPIALALDGSTVARALPASASVDTWQNLSVIAGLDQATMDRLGIHQRSLREMLNRIIHIPSTRPAIESTYSLREPAGWVPEETPFLLAADRSLLESTRHWMESSLGVESFTVDRAGFAFRLAARENRELVNIASAGRGTQSVLSIVVLLHAVATGRTGTELVILEEPEAHLHPSAHGDLADLVVMASAHAQVVVETHSENFILRLRRRVADATIANAESLGLYYVGEEHSIAPVAVDEFGGTPDWPVGVFESDIQEAEAIVNAKLQAIERAG